MLKNQKRQHTLGKVPDSLEVISNFDIEFSSFNISTQMSPINENVNSTNKCAIATKKKQTPVKLYMIKLSIFLT